MNQYFRLVEKDGSAVLKIFPSQDGGNGLDVRDVLAYLEEVGYHISEMRELNRAITQNEKEEEVPIGAWRGYHEQEKMRINVSGDRMLVYAHFYAPSNLGQVMSEEEIYKDLDACGIKVGIQENVVKEFTAKREYCKGFLIAKGIPPVQGRDARIDYLFNTNPNLKPQKNEDGTVDYHRLNTINHVEKGQCLARMEKEVPGQDGINVYGDVVPARQVKSKRFSYANNIQVSEDGTEIYSMVNGHVSLVKDKVFVADVYEVPADVDTATGDIEYDGNVLVKGNVKSGFKISTKGDIIVEGVVEGAQLYAGGQIILKRGIHGMNKGLLKAEGNIITKFIESATVSSNGYIETESILHSTVSARTDVRVGGKKAFITGGTVRAGNVVEAGNIGSEMGGDTKIEVGVEPNVKERYNKLQKEMQQLNKEIEQIRPILKNFAEKMVRQEPVSPEKQQKIQMLAKSLKEKQEQMAVMREEFEALHEKLLMSRDAKIKVRGTIYAGVWVSIADMGMHMKMNYSHSRIYKDKGDIVIRPI